LLSNPSSALNAISSLVGATTPDQQYINALDGMGGSMTYMAAVSPWFFTHYGPQTYDKNVRLPALLS